MSTQPPDPAQAAAHAPFIAGTPGATIIEFKAIKLGIRPTVRVSPGGISYGMGVGSRASDNNGPARCWAPGPGPREERLVTNCHDTVRAGHARRQR